MRRVGIVGYGLAGRVFHAPLISRAAGLGLAAVVTTDPRRAAQASADFPGVTVSPDVDAVLTGRSPVDVLVVATANAAHVSIASRAIDARVAVVVDKPVAPSSDAARLLVGRAQDEGVPLTVFHNRRWDGDFLTVAALVASDRLGSVQRFESRFERWSPTLREGSWREDPDPVQGAGLLLDLGSHLVDQAIVLFGPVATVYAELDRRRRMSEVDDDVFIALTHANGVRSHLWASAVAARSGPRFRACGASAEFRCYGLDPQEQQLKGGLRPGDHGWGVAPTDNNGTVGVGDEVSPMPTVPGAYETFYARLVDALDGRGDLPVDPWDAVRVIEVLEAARRAATRKTVVAIDRRTRT